MRKYFFALITLVFCLPSFALAEFEPPGHRWTIGYEYESGITLRRFLGENWEVFLGGGPNDSKREKVSENFRDSDEGIFGPYYERIDEDKTEAGFVVLGVGRTVLREDRFWLAGVLSVKYNWRNYQDKNTTEYLDSGTYRSWEYVGHKMTTAVYLGLRPSYDLTSRITLMVEFGIKFIHYTETKDDRWDNIRDSSLEVETQHSNSSSDAVHLYGYSGINSIRFFFRF